MVSCIQQLNRQKLTFYERLGKLCLAFFAVYPPIIYSIIQLFNYSILPGFSFLKLQLFKTAQINKRFLC
ncbi:hypothetical protein MOMA_07476 [Moraxella macacae 0408225]|uniref:Uncharacterized protein n=1 Tax=Moraxella macacae 0408225 TaxID=1230338 RepID=L2F7E6_9GAMM|nr:hypothetical protein MOMA_07476 [Moraxella macacae 0408225]